MSVETSNRIEEDTMQQDGNPEGEQETVSEAWTTPLPDFHSMGVGPALRIRRETLGWALPDVAAWLCIKQSYLEALEHDRTDTIPGGAYALGFLRTYANALGFPADKMVERFKHEVRGVVKKPELTFLSPVPEKTVPASALVLAGLVVVVVAYIGWYRMIGHEPVQLEQIPSVASVMPGMTNKETPSPQIASVMPNAIPSSPSPHPAPAPDVKAQGADTSLSGSDTLALASQLENLKNTEEGMHPASDDASKEAAVALIPSPPKPAAIRATAKSWVQVKSMDGRVVYDHIMEPEETWEFPAEGAPFTLTVGNAGGTVLTVDDVVTQPLGRNGAVRRNVTVTDAAIRDGSVAPLSSEHADMSAPSQSTTPKVDEVGEEGLAPVPPPPPPVVKPRVRPPAPVRERELSADDLNARQLNTLGSPSGSPHM